jgi:hypothetical protein
MKASPDKRNFETLILAIGILMAVVAAINTSSPIADGSSAGYQYEASIKSETEPVTAESGLNSSGNTCQYLKILAIN